MHSSAARPEECILSMGVDVPILPCTFHLLVQQPEVVFAWDVSGTYAHHRDQLSLLARRNGTERLRWMLKSPVHLIYVRHLQQVFKDAKIVWNHRDPSQSLPSLASLFRAFAEMFEGADIDLAALGREQLAFWSAALRRCDDDLAAPGALDHASSAREPRAPPRRARARVARRDRETPSARTRARCLARSSRSTPSS